MAATIFTRLRKSYFTKLVFSSILSNLVLFGEPMQYIIQGNLQNHIQQAIAQTMSHNKDKEILPHTIPFHGFRPKQLQSEDNNYFDEIKIFYAQEFQAVVGIDSLSDIENPLDNFFTVILPDTINLYDYDILMSYDLNGLAKAEQTTKRINNQVAYGGLDICTSQSWSPVSETVPASYLHAGRNEIHFNRRDEQKYKYSIKDLRIELKQKTNKDIILNRAGLTNQNGSIYIFAIINNSDILSVNVLGENIAVHQGIVERLLENVPKGTKALELGYKSNEGYKSINIPVSYSVDEPEYSFKQLLDKSGAPQGTGVAKDNLEFHDIKLTSVPNNLYNNSKIIVSGLQFKDIKALNDEIQVVTSGVYQGYRVQRQNFSDSLGTNISLKFDPSKIPAGYTENDIRTFYYDGPQRMWKVLPVDSLDITKHEIRTTTFFNDTDYINGVIKVPDSPETSSFAPTAMNDIKFADPAAGIVSIQPPSPNSTGSASTSFPLKVPGGRNGMQPSLQVSYNSEAGNGWMGMGWNLSVPSVSLNTKWGVPTYSGAYETELYALNGSDLVLKNGTDYTSPQKTPNIPKQPSPQSERQFYERKEGSFSQIIRKGTAPSNYYWIVTDKMGNKSYYGGYETGVVDNAVLKTTEGDIAHWALFRTEDTYGNYVQYNYNKGTTVINGVTSQFFYISYIDYTLRGALSTNTNFYRVKFIRNDTSRLDVTTSARLGFMQLTQSLLSEVQMFYVDNNDEKPIRKYGFTYYGQSDAAFSNPFKKSVLKSISEYDSAGALFYSHTMEYYNDVTGSSLIDDGETDIWSGAEDNISPVGVLSGLNLNTEGSALGTSTSIGGTGGLRVGGGLGFNVLSTATTAAGSGSYSYNENNTRISFIDLNGDGLPDKVFKDGNTIKYRPNLGLVNGSGQFGDYVVVTGLTGLGTTKTNTVGYGADLNLGVIGIGKSFSDSWSQTDDYFSDFNGDGLPDMVTQGQIKFNGTSGSDYNSRFFTPYVTSTENVITPGEISTQVLSTMDLPTEAELRANYAQFDHVKVWEAPYTGTVSISGAASLIQVNSCGSTNNFRLTIEKKHVDNNNQLVVSLVKFFDPLTSASGSALMTEQTQVNKGDLLFFRIHNKQYGCGGKLVWNPQVKYQVNQTEIYYNGPDENGKNISDYRYADDFILNNGGTTELGSVPVTLNMNFNLNAATLSALNLTDVVRFRIQLIRYDTTSDTDGQIMSNELRTYTPGVTLSPNTYMLAVNSGLEQNSNFRDVLYCTVESDSNINWALLKWKPTYTVSGSTDINYPGVTYLPFDNNVAQKKYWFIPSDFATPTITNDGSNPFMVISQNFNQINWGPYLDLSNTNSASVVHRKVSWLVKKRASGGTTILHKKIFYLNKLANGTFTLSRNENGSQVLIQGAADYNGYFSKTLTKQEVKDIKDAGAYIFTAFYIENSLVGGVENNFNPASITLAMDPGVANIVPYNTYVAKVLNSPFWGQSAKSWGYTYRGWGQFLYNGGVKHEDQSDYGLQPITATLFDIATQSDAAEAVGQADPNISPTDAAAMSPGLEIRYGLYKQLNGQNLYTLPLIKYKTNTGDVDVTFGPDAQNNLYTTMGRFGIGDIYSQFINVNTLATGGTNLLFVGLKQYSKSHGSANSANGGITELSGSGTLSNATSKVNNQYIDFNGDRYPDLVTPGAIQFTGMHGGFVQTPSLLSPVVHSSGSTTQEKTFGATISGQSPNSTTGDVGVRIFKGSNTQASSGINTTNGKSTNSNQWVDINGDGLPDKVSINTDLKRVVVNLNIGYKFSTQETDWITNLSGMDISSNSGGAASITGLTSFPSMSFALGLGGAQSSSHTETLFIDVNGDGLPDLVRRNSNGYVYHLNTGTSFTTAYSQFYNSSAGADRDVTISANFFGSYTFGISFPIFGIAIKATTTPSLSTTAGFSEKKDTFQDIDGDGLVDVVHQAKNVNNRGINGSIKANLNPVGKTYLLKKVNTPLGGSWEVFYAKSKNSYNMPNSKWLLTQVTTHDGFVEDDNFRPNTTLTTAKYETPNYSRREREFLGYAKVTTEQRNPDPAAPVLFRYVEEYYHNENFYLSGLKKGSGVFDASGNQLSGESTLFNILSPDNPTVNFNASSGNNFLQYNVSTALLDHSRLFIAVARVSSTTFEGPDALTAIKEFVNYDKYGNLKTFRDLGEGEEDVYKTVIDYHPSTIFTGIQNATGFPSKISVFRNAGNILMRERQATYYPDKGGLFEIITKLNGTESNKVSLEYDIYGNLKKVNDLENKNVTNTGNYSKEITYENVLNTFPTKVKNSFGDESIISGYSYLFGVPMFVKDVNGEDMRTRIDNRGRVVEVTGPNEMAQGVNSWTIRMEYKGEAAITSNILSTTHVLAAQGSFTAVPPGTATPTTKEHWAVTRHFDPEPDPDTGTINNQLLTITIADGFGQPIQVKKTHKGISAGATSNVMKWMVSGFDKADAFGRVIISRLPVKQDAYPTNLSILTGSLNYYEPSSGLATLTETEYDVKDRPVSVKQVGESEVAVMEYAIEGNRFVQSLENERHQTLYTYTDIRGRQRKTVQNNQITTKFEYNTINELIKVIDNENFETKYKYDLAGRKIEMCHPDRGVVTFKYDRASRMIEQSNSNLIPLNQKINYYYDCSRLVRIAYPQNPQNEVKYTYGTNTGTLAPLSLEQNAVGRVLYQEDASGVQVFGYGNMGEVNRNLRSVAVAGYQSYWFYTKWKYDSWNRIQEITYPDQETVSYHYNKAGALNRITSVMAGVSVVQPIVQEITYTDYGERASIMHGNNNITRYTYDTRRRMNSLKHQFQNNTFNITKNYGYDELSNIKKIETNTPQSSLPGTGKIGGPIYHEYTYDNYNRLDSAIGNYTGANDLTTPYLFTEYSLKMEYNSDHTIRKKTQWQKMGSVTAYGGTVSGSRPVDKTSYVLDYEGYGNVQYVTPIVNGEYGYQQPHAPRTITEQPSLEAVNANDPRIRQKSIAYDANGNQTQISETVGALTTSLRRNVWDEENRLKAVNLKPDDPTGHPVAIYTYDAGGARTVRYNYDRIDASVNATEEGQAFKENIMIYPSGLMMGKPTRLRKDNAALGNTLVYTKHYYIGSERVSAKTGTLSIFGHYPHNLLTDTAGNMQALNPTLSSTLVRNPSNATVTSANNTVLGVYSGFGVTPAPQLPVSPEGNIQYSSHEQGLLNYYYFHTDHLGSSSYITNSSGAVTQHMEYLPFGETLIDEHLNSNNSPFKFNGKEMDEETGNYYYGARYYDPKLSIFIGVDPLADKYPGISPYAYCLNNPINLTDPTGMEPDEPGSPPKRNILITINDGGDPIKPETWDSEVWHHITVNDISEANDALKKYLGDTKANNIVVNNHGGPVNDSEDRYIQIGVDNHITHEDMELYLNGGEVKKNGKAVNNQGIEDLITLGSYVKDGGNFIMTSCTAGQDNTLGNNISLVLENRTNLFLNNNLCYIPIREEGANHRDTRYIFTKPLYGPWDKYEANTGHTSTVKSIELMSKDNNNPVKFRQ